MSRKPLSLLGSAALLLAGLTALTGCGVSPAYTPVRTAVVAEPVAVETAPAPAQPVENVGYDDTDPAALTDFHETLAPYGTWEEDATYGTVWVPASERVGADFAPYKTAGHWELDQNEEWLWVSDYDDSFGWVVFHYGRWAHTEARGWVWIPGRRYAPAWVAWQTGDPGYGYIGWAAMPPAYYWHSGAVVWLDVYPTPYYVYCPTSYVFYRDWHSHAVPRQHVVAVATPMRPYGTPRGGGRVYAQPHRGPSARSGVVPPGSYPTSRHAMAEGHRRYAIPSSPATAGGGNGLGGSPRAGSRSRPQSFEAPGGPERGPGRAVGGSDGPSGRPSFSGGPDGGPTRSSSAFAGSSAPGSRSAPPVAAPPGRSSSAFDSRGPSSSPPMARVPSEGPTRMPPSSGPFPTPAGAPVARPSSPSFSGPVQAPSRPSAFSSPTRSAPSPSPVSAPSRAPSSFSAPSRASSPSFSAPSRASSPSFSAPSRASSPSFSAPSRASSPAVSSPSRSSSSSGSRPSAPSGGSRGRRLSPVASPRLACSLGRARVSRDFRLVVGRLHGRARTEPDHLRSELRAASCAARLSGHRASDGRNLHRHGRDAHERAGGGGWPLRHVLGRRGLADHDDMRHQRQRAHLRLRVHAAEHPGNARRAQPRRQGRLHPDRPLHRGLRRRTHHLHVGGRHHRPRRSAGGIARRRRLAGR